MDNADMSNPWADVDGVPDRQPAHCPYCTHDGAFDGLGSAGDGKYRHHCPACDQEFITILPEVDG